MILGHVFIEDLTVKVNGLDRACGGIEMSFGVS